jgi:predicted metal-dependent hydrolase
MSAEKATVLQLQLPFPLPLGSLESIFCEAYRELRPRAPLPQIRVEFFPFAGINHTAHLNDGRLKVRVSDIFDHAPEDVNRALALILLAKLYRKKLDSSVHRIYRAFILRTEIQERARVARSARGRGTRVSTTLGRHFDLDALFDRLNVEYFAEAVAKPKISWSTKRSRYILGRYDATHHTIFVSRIFDTPRVPPYVIEYVMYHEMLHVKHQTRVKNCRVVVHTPEFKQEERRFAQYEQAKEWLKQI